MTQECPLRGIRATVEHAESVLVLASQRQLIKIYSDRIVGLAPATAASNNSGIESIRSSPP